MRPTRADLPWLVVVPRNRPPEPSLDELYSANLERLAGDRELMDDVIAEGFRGPRYQELHDRLWTYAWTTLRGLVRSGRITGVRTNFPHQEPTEAEWALLHGSAPLREGLILDAITTAVPAFLTRLEGGTAHWSPEKGAGLNTYFTVFVTQHFWACFSKWSENRARELRALTNLQSLYSGPADGSPSGEDLVMRIDQQRALRRILRTASDDQKAIASLLLAGMTQAQIADRLQMTTRQVEARVGKLRHLGWQLVRRGKIDPSLVPGSRKGRHPRAVKVSGA